MSSSGTKNIRRLSSSILPDYHAHANAAPNPAASESPPVQPSRSLGIVTRQPMPDYTVSPPIFGPPDQSATSGDDMDDWFARWIKPLTR
jgi:hypothetical protein